MGGGWYGGGVGLIGYQTRVIQFFVCCILDFSAVLNPDWMVSSPDLSSGRPNLRSDKWTSHISNIKESSRP